jgi:23S rRNA (guanine2445-N2)-methyltransferase / 23S rRNA (guanine2069-N7)-methyltransferase
MTKNNMTQNIMPQNNTTPNNTTQNNKILNLFATTPKGLELLLVDELRALGASNPAEKLAGVSFSGDLTLAYKACLWSRLANRILLSLAKVPASTPEALYAGVKTINWSEHIPTDGSLAVHFVSSQSNITHTLFGAQKVKDAIVDQMRDKHGVRPNVSRERPDVSVYVYLYRNEASISLDLSGESLHKRGYRIVSGSAPLKENLAAAILLRAGWPAIAKESGSLLDPMCGSGTLLVEAALMAADIAPGLARDYYGFLGWKQHKAKVWDQLINEAKQRREAGMKVLPDIVGYDHDPISIKIAFDNIERAGMLGKVHVEKRELAAFAPKQNAKPGLVVTNPPYGERIGDINEIQPLYALFAGRLKQGFLGWKAALFTGNPDLGKQMGLRAKRYYALFNGTIPCKLLLFDVQPEYFIDRSPEAENERRIRAARKTAGVHVVEAGGQDKRAEQDKQGKQSKQAEQDKQALDPGQVMQDEQTTQTEQTPQAIQMFVNRLRKNLKHLKRQAKKRGEGSYRVYDADLPEYAFAIDITPQAVQVQEYQAPKTANEEKVLLRRNQVLAVLPEVLEVDAKKIFFSIK